MNRVDLKMACIGLVWPKSVADADVWHYLDKAQHIYEWAMKEDTFIPSGKVSPDTAKAPGKR